LTFLSTCQKNISDDNVLTTKECKPIYMMHRWTTKDTHCSLIIVKTELSNEMHISQGRSQGTAVLHYFPHSITTKKPLLTAMNVS